MTPQQWIKATDAIGIVSKSGRYGGTYAHTDIAFEFASWISPEFKLFIMSFSNPESIDAVISILQRAKYINFTSKSEQQKTE